MASKKSAVASNAVRNEWLRRVEAEYRSASITQHLTLWLIQIGASPDLIRAGLRITGDEMMHAELSHRTYLAAGGTAMPELARETLGLREEPNVPLEVLVLRTCVQVFCLGETVAVPLFKNLRDDCTVPSAKRALDRILKDEVRHRDFGWLLLGWLAEHPMWPQLREEAIRSLPSYFGMAKRTYAPSAAKKLVEISTEDRSWGLMAPALYAQVLERTLERDWIPRFRKFDIDAAAAWAKSSR